MDIRFVSSLTPEDEARVASTLVEVVGALLDGLPLAYSLQVETSSGKTLQRTHAPNHIEPIESDQPPDPPPD